MKLTREDRVEVNEPQPWVKARMVFEVSIPVRDVEDYLGDVNDPDDRLEFKGNSDEELVEYLALAGTGLTGNDETLAKINSVLWEIGCIETDWPTELDITLEVK